MDENAPSVSEATLDRALTEAAADLQEAWKRRLIQRFQHDADGDDEDLRRLSAALIRPCQDRAT